MSVIEGDWIRKNVFNMNWLFNDLLKYFDLLNL